MALGPFTPKDHVEITTLGLEFALAVALGTACGWWADKHFGALPWLTVSGVLAGFALGMYILIKSARNMARTDGKPKEDKKNGSI